MSKKDIEKKMAVRRTRNRLASNLDTLEENKQQYIEKTKAARAKGDKHVYSLARSGLAATVAQSKRTREMLLHIDITSQMRDTGAVTEEFLTGMETIFKRLSKINKSVDIKKARKGLRSAIMGMETVQAQLDGMLEESEDTFAELAGQTDSVTDKEIDRLLGLSAAIDEEEAVGAAVDEILRESQPSETSERAFAAATSAGGATPFFDDRSDEPRTAPPQRSSGRQYALPDIELLSEYGRDESARETNECALEEDAAAVEKVLAELGVPAKVSERVTGPAFSRLEMAMPSGLSVQKIDALLSDIAMRLGKPARLEVPIPGKNAFGIEVQNVRRETVGLKELILSEAFETSGDGIRYCLGADIDRTPVVKDLTGAPHMLVAGCTGSGKSCFLHAMLVSMLYTYTPDKLQLAVVDLKRVEMAAYNGVPHLTGGKVVDTDEEALALFERLADEMERRYTLLLGAHCRDVKEYNRTAAQPLPYIVAVADEYADISTGPLCKPFEAVLRKLSQKSRAAGIHLVLATQRPSVDVVSGTLKSNFPTQAAFRVVRKEDSRTVLAGQSGAEQLLGNGDMLFAEAGVAGLRRLQAPYVSSEEVRRVCDYWRRVAGRA